MSQRKNVLPSRTSKESSNPLACPRCHYARYPATGNCTNWECKNHEGRRGAITAEQLMKEYTPPPLFHGRMWGEWTLDIERLCLVFNASAPQPCGEGSDINYGVPPYTGYFGTYEIDLERIRDSAALCDWIFQIRCKGWATARVIKDFLNAMRDIIHPQQNLCSGACGSGWGGRVIKDPAAFLAKRIATVGTPREDALEGAHNDEERTFHVSQTTSRRI
jgi:hypothetical protein